jgi:DinB superfamily
MNGDTPAPGPSLRCWSISIEWKAALPVLWCELWSARVGIPEERETGSLLNSLDTYDLTRRDRRLMAPDPVMPRGDYTAAQGLAALALSREALLAAIRSGDGLALGELTFPHPLLGSLDLYQWILFVGQHEARHAAQIAEIGRAATGRGPGTRSP